MQKELLPWAKLKNQLLIKLLSETDDKAVGTISNSSISTGQNLLAPEEPHRDLIKDKVSRLLKLVIFFISLLFLTMLGINYFFDTQLRLQKMELDISVQQIEEYNDVMLLARDIDRKVTLYKQIKEDRKVLGENLTFVYDSIIEGVTLSELDINVDGFNIKVEGDSAFTLAKLLATFLRGDEVSQLTLKSANLNKERNSFMVELGGVFKQ